MSKMLFFIFAVLVGVCGSQVVLWVLVKLFRWKTAYIVCIVEADFLINVFWISLYIGVVMFIIGKLHYFYKKWR